MAKRKDPAVDARMFDNIYVCMRCNATLRSAKPVDKSGAKCRKCGSKGLRHKRKHVKSAA